MSVDKIPQNPVFHLKASAAQKLNAGLGSPSSLMFSIFPNRVGESLTKVIKGVAPLYTYQAASSYDNCHKDVSSEDNWSCSVAPTFVCTKFHFSKMHFKSTAAAATRWSDVKELESQLPT